MGPKPVYTLWPYGQAGDSAGSDQGVDRPGHDDQIHGRSNIGPVGGNTIHDNCNFQLRQNRGCPGSIES